MAQLDPARIPRPARRDRFLSLPTQLGVPCAGTAGGVGNRGRDLSRLASGVAPDFNHAARGGGRMSGQPLLLVRDAHRDYPRSVEPVHAVRGVSLEVAHGEYVAIVGPSGCGKSTLLNLLGAIDRPTTGSVTIAGTAVTTLPDKAATHFRLTNIGFVFQRFYLLPVLTARENVELPMAEAKVPLAERRDRARELL